MKIDPLEAHDRLDHFKKQEFSIGECVQDLVNQRPFGDVPFYIFAHPRTDDDGVTKRMIWQPRLTKPKAQTNSMLFKAFPPGDTVKIIWMIPARELWGQFESGKLTADPMIAASIYDFQNNRKKLEAPDPDDLDDKAVDSIYRSLSRAANYKKFRESGTV